MGAPRRSPEELLQEIAGLEADIQTAYLGHGRRDWVVAERKKAELFKQLEDTGFVVDGVGEGKLIKQQIYP